MNAGLTTQLLLTLFRVKGVVHFGIAGNANTKLQIGDVTIPHYWAHTGLWNWQVLDLSMSKKPAILGLIKTIACSGLIYHLS